MGIGVGGWVGGNVGGGGGAGGNFLTNQKMHIENLLNHRNLGGEITREKETVRTKC